jgi:hypothetical protein
MAVGCQGHGVGRSRYSHRSFSPRLLYRDGKQFSLKISKVIIFRLDAKKHTQLYKSQAKAIVETRATIRVHHLTIGTLCAGG